MLFKDIKQNYPIFILNKDELKVIQGKAVSVSFPHIDTNYKPMSQQPMAMPGAMVVDVVIEAEGKSATYAIPENLSVTYAGNLVLSTDREGLAREVEAMKSTAEQILASMDNQKEIIKKASGLMAELNPTYREKVQTEERFGKIEGAIADIGKMMKDQQDMLDKFIKEFKS